MIRKYFPESYIHSKVNESIVCNELSSLNHSTVCQRKINNLQWIIIIEGQSWMKVLKIEYII